MTTLGPIPEPTTPTEPWDDLLAQLKTRYPRVREPIVVALAVLMQEPGIGVDHAQAVAAANGFRITAASVAAAQRLLTRQDGGGAAAVGEDPQDARQAGRAEHGPRAAPTDAARCGRPGGADPRGRRDPGRRRRRGRSGARRDADGNRGLQAAVGA